MTSGAGPDLESVESFENPAGYFASFRRHGPVQWSDAQRAWVVIGHGAAQAAFADTQLLSADRIGALERFAAGQPTAFGRVVDLLRGWMIFRDPPAHTRLREPVRQSFTHRRVNGLQTAIVRIADQLIEQLAATGPEVDVHSAFCRPFPALVIGALLGLEDADPSRLQDWSDALAAIVFAVRPSDRAPIDAIADAAAAFEAYFGPLVAHARQEAGDDLISQVARIQDADLSDRELIGLCTMLLFAGHETTTGFLTNSLASLLDDGSLLARFLLPTTRPDHQFRLPTTRPDHQLSAADASADLRAIDELMRVNGPARTMIRKVAVEHDREGCRLRVGENVFISITAGNHDATVFEAPERVDLAREPNPQLGFGWGLHHCLGAQLARVESAIALRRLVTRFPAMHALEPVPRPMGSTLGLVRHPGIVHLA